MMLLKSVRLYGPQMPPCGLVSIAFCYQYQYLSSLQKLNDKRAQQDTLYMVWGVNQ